MFGLKTGELLIIFAVLLLLFGGSRLPQLGAALGKSIKNFKKGFGEDGTPDEEPKQSGVLSAEGSVKEPMKVGSKQA